MGSYTNIRMELKIKKEYRNLVQKIVLENKEWDELEKEYEFLKNFSKNKYSKNVVNGWSASAPEEWYEGEFDEEIPTDGYENNFDEVKNVWKFQSSFKNYEKVLDIFVEEVLKEIVQEVIHMEVHKEENNFSELYTFKNGHFIKKKEKKEYESLL